MEATLRGGQRTGHRQAGRPARFHRGPGGRRAARDLRGHRRPEHPRGRGQRPDQRQDAAGQSQRRRGAVPRDRGHGLPRRLHAAAAASPIRPRASRSSIPTCSASGPGACTRSTAARSSASRTKTRPSKKLYDEFLGGPGTEKAHELLHTHYRPSCPEASDERPPAPTTGNKWRRRPRRSWASRSWRSSSECRQRPRAGKPTDRRPAQGPGRSTATWPRRSSTPWPN